MDRDGFCRALLAWYDREKRELPWRGTQDPYRVWLSEIMLQQTRAEAVAPRYEAFLTRFPTVAALAAADEEAVLKAWEGMGYYSRARNLRRAAMEVVRRGGFPRSAKEWQKLPGVGAYTAAAVASIAYHEAAPALDGNQARVLSRLLAFEGTVDTPQRLRAQAEALIDRERPGDYNQALMDLGSGVCTPRAPKCGLCPVAAFCAARAGGDAESYPHLPPPIARREVEVTVVLAYLGGRVLVRRRPSKGLLAGLWEFPNFSEGTLEDTLPGARATGELARSRHVFTHLVWNMRGLRAEAEALPEGMRAVDADELRALPFPTALRVYRQIAMRELGGEAEKDV
ncbi:MAG TPA: A/G-specific adenine glycosylase [Candidatus Pullichristensenella stercoripullorum]|nr:A/G-specific adenine glycosylase [Candidatus Pullichristensenella stercoripullorum]